MIPNNDQLINQKVFKVKRNTEFLLKIYETNVYADPVQTVLFRCHDDCSADKKYIQLLRNNKGERNRTILYNLPTLLWNYVDKTLKPKIKLQHLADISENVRRLEKSVDIP